MELRASGMAQRDALGIAGASCPRWARAAPALLAGERSSGGTYSRRVAEAARSTCSASSGGLGCIASAQRLGNFGGKLPPDRMKKGRCWAAVSYADPPSKTFGGMPVAAVKLAACCTACIVASARTVALARRMSPSKSRAAIALLMMMRWRGRLIDSAARASASSGPLARSSALAAPSRAQPAQLRAARTSSSHETASGSDSTPSLAACIGRATSRRISVRMSSSARIRRSTCSVSLLRPLWWPSAAPKAPPSRRRSRQAASQRAWPLRRMQAGARA